MEESVNSLVPQDDAELAILLELFICGGEGDTGYIVERAMARFPVLQTQKELNRETPSGRGWWSGRFRFNISNLGKRGEAVNVKRGLWRITEKVRILPEIDSYLVSETGVCYATAID